MKITEDTGLPIYLCDPHSPWHRGTNENTNGLLSSTFPKCTNVSLSLYGPGILDNVAAELNARPRTVGRTPAERTRPTILRPVRIRCSDRLNPRGIPRGCAKSYVGEAMSGVTGGRLVHPDAVGDSEPVVATSSGRSGFSLRDRDATPRQRRCQVPARRRRKAVSSAQHRECRRRDHRMPSLGR
jgi:hypothetical protein